MQQKFPPSVNNNVLDFSPTTVQNQWDEATSVTRAYQKVNNGAENLEHSGEWRASRWIEIKEMKGLEATKRGVAK